MALTVWDWQAEALALTANGDETAADAMGLVTVRVVAEGEEGDTGAAGAAPG